MIAKIEQLLSEVEAMKADSAEELEALRIKYLSKKGAINELMADFRNVPAEHKKEVGIKLNELKQRAQERIAALKEAFESQDHGRDEHDDNSVHVFPSLKRWSLGHVARATSGRPPRFPHSF